MSDYHPNSSQEESSVNANPPDSDQRSLRASTVQQREFRRPPPPRRRKKKQPRPSAVASSESDNFEDARDNPTASTTESIHQPPPPPTNQHGEKQPDRSPAVVVSIPLTVVTVSRTPTTFNSTNMSAPVPPEVIAALSPSEQAALRAWVATITAPVINIPTVKVKQLNSNLKVPTYHALKKSGATYIDELESYFKSQGLEQADFLEALPAAVDEEIKAWYRHKKTTGYNWAKFKVDFLARYDSDSYKQRRQQFLVNRKQKENEPVESFIWEMMDLAKQVFPIETTTASVERCRQALVPRLKVALSGSTSLTPEDLIEKCTNVISDLRCYDRERGQRSQLPPIHNYSNTTHRGGQNGRFQRGGFRSNFTFTRPYANAAEPQPSSSQQQRYTPRPEQPTSSSQNVTRSGYTNHRQFKYNTRGTFRRPTTHPQSNNPHASTKCYACKATGHIAAQCPVTAFFIDDGEKEEDIQVTPPDNREDLNMQGGQ